MDYLYSYRAIFITALGRSIGNGSFRHLLLESFSA